VPPGPLLVAWTGQAVQRPASSVERRASSVPRPAATDGKQRGTRQRADVQAVVGRTTDRDRRTDTTDTPRLAKHPGIAGDVQPAHSSEAPPFSFLPACAACAGVCVCQSSPVRTAGQHAFPSHGSLSLLPHRPRLVSSRPLPLPRPLLLPLLLPPLPPPLALHRRSPDPALVEEELTIS
jgi:hypothetical protein